MARTITTYSIAACDLDASQWGVATQSKFLAVGAVVPWAEPHVGAIATQAYANPRYGPEGLSLLREGLSAEEVVERLTAADEGRDQRQLGVVDREGRSASFTGGECLEWAGGRTGPCYAAQGNILVSAETVDAIAETFESSKGPLAERLLDCLDAAQAAVEGETALGLSEGVVTDAAIHYLLIRAYGQSGMPDRAAMHAEVMRARSTRSAWPTCLG